MNRCLQNLIRASISKELLQGFRLYHLLLFVALFFIFRRAIHSFKTLPKGYIIDQRILAGHYVRNEIKKSLALFIPFIVYLVYVSC